MLTMHDESAPWSAIDFRKYQLYLEMRKQRDKFLKSLREKRHGDWLIEKKLLEGGGLGDTVYIYPARANGKVYTQLKLYKELLAKGKNVEFVTFKKPEPKPHSKNIERLKELVSDPDMLLSDRADRYFAELIGEHIHAEFRQHLLTNNPYLDPVYHFDYKPIVKPDAYVFNTPSRWLHEWKLLDKLGIIYRAQEREE